MFFVTCCLLLFSMFVVCRLLSVVVCHLALFVVVSYMLFVHVFCFLFVIVCLCLLFVVVPGGVHKICFGYNLSSTQNACRK